MAAILKLRFQPDIDGTGELFAEAHSGGYSGIGSAWFDGSQLISFAQSLASAYPLRQDEPIKLAGGFYSKSGEGIEQLHLGLNFYPIGSTGQIGCRVVLNTPTYENSRPDSQSSLTVELHTNYEQLGAFARSLEALAKGNMDEAILETTG